MTLFTGDRTGASPQRKRAPIRQLVESAFDFLGRAAKEIGEHPKYSIINFATAIELALKARLMKEHWTLVVEKSSEAIQKDFLDGKSKTVTAREAIRRLRNVTNETVAEDAQKAFEAIADHRNRVIHFYHEAASSKAPRAQIEAIVREQCLGWYHLERLLKHWGKPFSNYAEDIKRIDELMRKNWHYLKAVYDSELPTIREDLKKGRAFAECGGCEFKAAEVSDMTDKIVDHDCRVCNLSQRFVVIKCPDEDCGGTVRMEADHGSKRICDRCGYKVKTADIEAALSTEDYDPSDFSPAAKNCAFCMGYHKVVEHNELYVCTECLAVEEDIATCGWCSEQQVGGGDLEDSYITGCEFCEGKGGWDGDKD